MMRLTDFVNKQCFYSLLACVCTLGSALAPAQVFASELKGARILADAPRAISTKSDVAAPDPARDPERAITADSNEINSANADTSKRETANPIEVEKWEFGVVIDRSGPTKDWKLHPVVLIPNLPGVQYAWKLKTNSKLPLFVREEFTLPESPSTWKLRGDESSQLLKGGEQCVLESFQATDEGWIGHAWTASNGDPGGKYQIKVWLNGKLAHEFLFNVGDAAKLGSESRDW